MNRRRVVVVDGNNKGKMGYADVADDDLKDVAFSRLDRKNRYRGLWVTLDPEPSVTFGGSPAARSTAAWLMRYNVHVLTMLEEMADLKHLDAKDTLCVCNHPQKVHFASRCFMPNCNCACTAYRIKEEN